MIGTTTLHGLLGGGNSCSAWNITNECYSYDDINFYLADVYLIRLSRDGDKMYTIGTFSYVIKEYLLTTSWDVSTATYNQQYNFGGSGYVYGISFNNDGDLLFISRREGTSPQYSHVEKYSLSTAWDISSLSNTDDIALLNGDFASSISISDDGYRLYSNVENDSKIYQHDLSTAFDLSTLTYASKSITTNYRGLYINDGGDKIYDGKFNQYNLSTPYELDSAILKNTFTIQSSASGLDFKPDGTKFYTSSPTLDTIYQYSI